MKENILKFRTYLQDAMTRCGQQIEALNNDFKKDEADMVKIRKNVYDIFLKVFNVAVKTAENKENESAKIKMFFEEKLHTIPENWRHSLEMAKAHEDARKVLEEEVKLKAVADIEKIYDEIWKQRL